MVDAAIMLPFVLAMNGYATARDNKEMESGCSILMVVPFFSDIVFGDTKGYIDIANQPTGLTLGLLAVAIGIVGISWGIGYAIGSWRN